jgi:hypothetical protein
MGKNKSKKIRNWKARQVVEGVIDDRETKELAEKVIIDDPQVKQKRKKNRNTEPLLIRIQNFS